MLSDDEDEGQDEDKLKKEAYEKKKKKAMIEEEPKKKRYNPTEIREIEKKNKEIKLNEKMEREEDRKKFRESQTRVAPILIKKVEDDFIIAKKDKIAELKSSLKEKPEELKRLLIKLNQTKIYVVDQTVWSAQIRKKGMDPSSTHAMYDRESNEIFISQRRTLVGDVREKSIRHEVDHVVCGYAGIILPEGHADNSAIEQMGKRAHPTLVTYDYPLETYRILADLAGESRFNNSTAYSEKGTEQLIERLQKKYGDKMYVGEIREKVEYIVSRRIKHSEYAYNVSKELEKKLKSKNR